MSVLLLMVGLLPACRLKNVMLSRLGREWSVARSASIQPSVLWGVVRLHVGERATIGPGNVFRDLQRLELADDAGIGQFNWVTAEARYADQVDVTRSGALVLHEGAAIASRHYLDCAGGLELGRMAILAGVRTTVLTHWADHRNWVLRAAPVTVGTACIISSGVTITAGGAVPDGCVVAAGAVVPKSLPEPEKLYAGVPAKPIGDLSGSAHARRTTPRFARPEVAVQAPPVAPATVVAPARRVDELENEGETS